MIATSSKRSASSAARSAPTRPSIMSEGATTSAPASACETATRASRPTVASLSTSPPSTRPQWPCEVYSHRQTSVATSMSGVSRLIARTAACTGASGSSAALPASSLSSGRGRPNSRTDRTPSPAAAAVSATARSTDNWNTPGIDGTSRRTPPPAQTNRGRTSASAERRVSRTRPRSAAERRRRRGRRGRTSVSPDAARRAPASGGEAVMAGLPARAARAAGVPANGGGRAWSWCDSPIGKARGRLPGVRRPRVVCGHGAIPRSGRTAAPPP